MNLSTFDKLNPNDSVYVLLKQGLRSTITAYMMTGSVSYTVIATYEFRGQLDTGIVLLNVNMSTLSKLLNKGYSLDLTYEDNTLSFVCNKGKPNEFGLKPISVVSADENLIDNLSRISELDKKVLEFREYENKLQKLRNGLQEVELNPDSLKILLMSGYMDGSPFGSGNDLSTEDAIDAKVNSMIENRRKEITNLESNPPSDIYRVDFADIKPLVAIAARGNQFVDFLGDMAIVSYKEFFVLQKAKCPIMSVRGKTLSILLSDGGEFFSYKGELVYIREGLVVFLTQYQPSTSADLSMLHKKPILEKYTIDMSQCIPIMSLVSNNFSFMFDMNTSSIIMESSEGDTITHKLIVSSVETVELNRLKRDLSADVDTTLSRFNLPSSAIRILGYFSGSVNLYIKKSTIIIKNTNLYLIFGRT